MEVAVVEVILTLGIGWPGAVAGVSISTWSHSKVVLCVYIGMALVG